MASDPIVEEVRRIRHQIDRECQDDSQQYYEHVRDFQRKLGARLVCRKPKPLPIKPEKETS